MTKKTPLNAENIIKEHQSKLKSFIRKRVSNSEEVNDILQDVFYQLIKTIENDLNPIEQVTAWLYRVTKNIIINKSKKKKEVELSVFENNDSDVLYDFSEIIFNKNKKSSTPETEYLRSMVWEELYTALSLLPEEQRSTFELMELEGLSAKEVSASMGVSVNTVLSRKHYAILHLRKRLVLLYKEILEE